jgi:hypothetical protein
MARCGGRWRRAGTVGPGALWGRDRPAVRARPARAGQRLDALHRRVERDALGQAETFGKALEVLRDQPVGRVVRPVLGHRVGRVLRQRPRAVEVQRLVSRRAAVVVVDPPQAADHRPLLKPVEADAAIDKRLRCSQAGRPGADDARLRVELASGHGHRLRVRRGHCYLLGVDFSRRAWLRRPARSNNGTARRKRLGVIPTRRTSAPRCRGIDASGR